MLRIWVCQEKEYIQAELLEADYLDQRVTYCKLGGGPCLTAPYRLVESVVLVDDYTGEILENYGPPKNLPGHPQEIKRPRASRPLIEPNTYFERRYCNDCMLFHFVEVTPRGEEICHGENYYFDLTHKTHYAKRLGRGFTVHPYEKFFGTKSAPATVEEDLVEQHDNRDW